MRNDAYCTTNPKRTGNNYDEMGKKQLRKRYLFSKTPYVVLNIEYTRDIQRLSMKVHCIIYIYNFFTKTVVNRKQQPLIAPAFDEDYHPA